MKSFHFQQLFAKALCNGPFVLIRYIAYSRKRCLIGAIKRVCCAIMTLSFNGILDQLAQESVYFLYLSHAHFCATKWLRDYVKFT